MELDKQKKMQTTSNERWSVQAAISNQHSAQFKIAMAGRLCLVAPPAHRYIGSFVYRNI